MIENVKGLKLGDKVIIVTFDANELPADGGFKGWIIDHKVSEIINDTTVRFENCKDSKKNISFNFRDDTVNCFYSSKEKTNWYTGIFTNIQMMFDQYKDLYAKIKGFSDEKKDHENE